MQLETMPTDGVLVAEAHEELKSVKCYHRSTLQALVLLHIISKTGWGSFDDLFHLFFRSLQCS